MPNVTLGEECTIGACALVNRDIPCRALAVGIPAKVIKVGKEYIKENSQKEKIVILKNIFKDFISYYSSLGWIFNVIEEKSSHIKYKIIDDNKNEYILIINFSNLWDKTFDKFDTHFISLYNINTEMREKIIEKNISWFDLEAKTMCCNRSIFNIIIKDFLGRYGIRLKYIERKNTP